ncbi:MAG TPA: long-chain fatty acid--CoA ligase [Candidatus Angelobacter sp.]|jgi:long-chain acyl-CoA synthetase|nr:long-chain fatty acid--CoA ligase [Candidatus Angelobacter sp.]
MEAKTLVDVFFASVGHNLERHVAYKSGGVWKAISARQYYGYVAGVSRALQQWGIQRGDRVAILSENRPEWMIADFACVTSGIIDVPVYTTLTAEQTLYLLQNSGARAIFVSNQEQLRKIQSIQKQTALEKIVVMDDAKDADVIPLWSILKNASVEADPVFDEQARRVLPGDIATLIYTSGTTGASKGVILTHLNLTSNAATSVKNFEWQAGDTYLSFLPLSHVTARHLDYVCFLNGVTIAYCPAFDQLPVMLQEAKPSIIVAVPRVYEKIRQEVEHKAARGVARRILSWSLKVGERHKDEVVRGEQPSSLAWKLANKLVYSKVRHLFGGNSRVYVSGGAPLGHDMAEWFGKVGIPIFEGYGLTETSPVIASNRRAAYKVGTVGKPVEHIQMKLAEDGEILVKGPSIFKGYWNMPEETKAAFTEDGWFKTGDIGQVDGEGFLTITDRKKDLIKTSGGKFIAPQPIENALKNNVLIAQAAVIGEKRKYASVIISPNFGLLEDWARTNHVSFTNHEELVRHLQVRKLYQGIIEELNKNLAHFETIKKIIVVPDEFSIATGEITPTLKLKRRVVEAKYKQLIDLLYQEPHPVEIAPVG